jgi:tetratricopeptide (TPR) repeat protein
MQQPSAPLHQRVLHLMQIRNWHAAAEACEQLNAEQPELAAGWLAAGQIALALGRRDDACRAATAAQRGAGRDALLWDAIGTLYSRANEQARALNAYEQALLLAPDNPHILFNRAAVRRFLGELEGAELDYDRVIELRPDDFEAFRNRSDLRPQTQARNHLAQLENALAQNQALDRWRAATHLHYTLAKEYEDIGNYQRCFDHLQRGAHIRRGHLRYDITTDLATVDWIIQAYPALLEATTARCCAVAPIFIVGLPRSGSTLVERILSSHSEVSSAGELTVFALAIVDAVRRRTGGAQLSREQLIAESAHLDFVALGHDYVERARLAGASGDRFIDKMPLNYLYCGMIHRALPNARIVHVSREPMAACYAMYKTLFEDGYPFSYDLTEIGQYYLGYHRLMQHWHDTVPGAMLSLSYEALIADQAGETRRLLEFLGLEWQQACLQFHQNPSPSTTASAAQVRRPIYDSSVSQWRHHRTQLADLSRMLSMAGISVD